MYRRKRPVIGFKVKLMKLQCRSLVSIMLEQHANAASTDHGASPH